MSKKKEQKQLMEFLQALVRLSEVEVIGVARILKVPLVVDENGNSAIDANTLVGILMPRPAESIISDILDKFIVMDKTKKTNLLKIVSAAAQNSREDRQKSYLGKNDRAAAPGGNADAVDSPKQT